MPVQQFPEGAILVHKHTLLRHKISHLWTVDSHCFPTICSSLIHFVTSQNERTIHTEQRQPTNFSLRAFSRFTTSKDPETLLCFLLHEPAPCDAGFSGGCIRTTSRCLLLGSFASSSSSSLFSPLVVLFTAHDEHDGRSPAAQRVGHKRKSLATEHADSAEGKKRVDQKMRTKQHVFLGVNCFSIGSSSSAITRWRLLSCAICKGAFKNAVLMPAPAQPRCAASAKDALKHVAPASPP